MSFGGSPVTILADGQHNAFPGVAWLDATRILLVYRRGTSHLTAGDIYGKIGTVTGTTVAWGSGFLIYSHATEDVRCDDSVSIIDNQVVIVGRLYNGTANHSPFLVICDAAPASLTSSSTWGTPISIPLTLGSLQNTCVDRVHKLQNGTYLVGFNSYSASPVTFNGVLISSSLTDWSARTAVTISNLHTEIDVEELADGTLIAHLRAESPKVFAVSTSTDHGLTWTSPTSLFTAWGLPMFRRLTSGLQLSVHRTATSPYQTYWRQSADGGSIWSGQTSLDNTIVGLHASNGSYATLAQLDSTHALCIYGIEDESNDVGSPSNLYSQVFTDTTVTAAAGVGMDWDNDGFSAGAYDDVSSDVVSWVITRGASPEITGSAQAGSATLVLRRTNRDGRYNPRNSGSPLYGLLRDGVRVHIAIKSDGTLSAGGTAYGLFAGRVKDITQIASVGTSDPPLTEFVCEDPLAWYARTAVRIPDSRRRSHLALRLAVLAAIGETRYDLASEIGTMPLSAADGDAFSVLSAINAANGTRHFAKPAAAADTWYSYTTRNRQYKLAGVGDATLDAGSEHVTGTDGWRYSADTVVNQQRATVTPTRFRDLLQKVWERTSLPVPVTTSTIALWADFDDYVDAPELEIVSTGSALTSVLTSFGRSAKIELTSAGTTSVTHLAILGQPVERGLAESVVIDDTTSQAGPRGARAGAEISGDYVGVRAMADGIARHMVWRYGNPQMRPTLTVANWFPEQFELDLFDVIAFTSDQLRETATLFEIVGLTHTGYLAASSAQYHETTYVLQESRVQTATAWFTLDTSELDGSDILAY